MDDWNAPIEKIDANRDVIEKMDKEGGLHAFYNRGLRDCRNEVS